MDLSDEGLLEVAYWMQTEADSDYRGAHEKLKQIREAAREQALQDAIQSVHASFERTFESCGRDWRNTPDAGRFSMIAEADIRALKAAPTGAATTSAPPAASPASSPGPTDPDGRAS